MESLLPSKPAIHPVVPAFVAQSKSWVHPPAARWARAAVFLFSPWWFSLPQRRKLRRCTSVGGAICRAAASVQVIHQHRAAFYVRGRQSGKYLGATHDGHVIHDDIPTDFHLFVLVPGMDVFTGYVKLYHLASDRSIFVTQDGLLGCYHGDFEEHWWKMLERDDKGSFSLVNFATEFLLYSNADGRLGTFQGDYFEDQLFFCQQPGPVSDGRVQGPTVTPMEVEGLFGLEDAGFLWEGQQPVYTDAFQVRHYVRDASRNLQGIGEVWRSLAPLSWGSGVDRSLAEMPRPHHWAIEHIPFLKHLAQQGLISESHGRNAVHASRPIGHVRFRHNGLQPFGAISFALAAVSDGQQVPLQRSWKRAWHGSTLHRIEQIAHEGLKVGKKGIYLSPSFQYTFCLYSLPDLRVGNDRFRLVVEVRVRPGAFQEHGDHYKSFTMKHAGFQKRR